MTYLILFYECVIFFKNHIKMCLFLFKKHMKKIIIFKKYD